MAKLDRVNGHRPRALRHRIPPHVVSAPRPQADRLAFDLDRTLAAVLSLWSEVPDDAFTAGILGTEREGGGILIDDNGLVLTIGYLIVEAEAVWLATPEGRVSNADIVAYDHDTGFGLVRARDALGAPPLAFGSSSGLAEGDSVIVAGPGGHDAALDARVVSKREFAGYWEYLLDDAIFTAPPHPDWGGAALVGEDGKLRGVGSLFVQDAVPGDAQVPGNMFVPIDLLKPVLGELLALGRVNRPARPWLGMFTVEDGDRLVVAGLAARGPAHEADVRAGDMVVGVDGEPVHSLADMLRKTWRLGTAGVMVRLTLLRDGEDIDVWVRSADRNDFLKLPRAH